MESCHYCFEAIDKLSGDYDNLYKEVVKYRSALQHAEKIIKQNNYRNVLCEIDFLWGEYGLCFLNEERGDPGWDEEYNKYNVSFVRWVRETGKQRRGGDEKEDYRF